MQKDEAEETVATFTMSLIIFYEASDKFKFCANLLSDFLLGLLEQKAITEI